MFAKCFQIHVEYRGKEAHSGAAPWEGVNALDAAVGAYVNVSMLRQQMKPSWKATGKLYSSDLPLFIALHIKRHFLKGFDGYALSTVIHNMPGCVYYKS